MTTPVILSSAGWMSVLTFNGSIRDKYNRISPCIRCKGIHACQFSKALLSLCTLVYFSVFSAPIRAQSFAELDAMLLTHPQLQSLSYEAASNREQSAAAMGLPDPVVSIGINNFPIFDPSFSTFLPTNKALGVQQRIPSRASRKAQSALGLAQASQSEEVRNQLYAAMRAELIGLLQDKKRIEKQVSLAEQRNAKYDELIEVVESEVGGARSSVFRLAEIEAERAEVALTLVDLRAQATQLEARLIYLIGASPQTDPPAQTVPAWSGDWMEFHASRVADAAVKVGGSGVDKAKSAWKPEWGAQLTYQQRDSGVNFAGDDWVSMMVTVTVPFWSKGKQAPNLRAAEANQAAAQAALDSARREASAQYTYSQATYLAAKEAREVLLQKVEAVNAEIEAQRAIYESGAGSYAAILDGEIVLLKLQAEIAAEQARSAFAVAKMNALLVTP